MTPSDSQPAAPSAAQRPSRGSSRRMKQYLAFMTCAVIVIAAGVLVAIRPRSETGRVRPTHSVPYLGVYQPDAPASYAGLNQFARNIGRQPNLVSYYSPWREAFQVGFAATAGKHGD